MDKDAEYVRLLTCPDCRGTGRGAGFPSKEDGVWQPPFCGRCHGRGDLVVTLSGDSRSVYLSDEEGRVVTTFDTLDEAARAVRMLRWAAQIDGPATP